MPSLSVPLMEGAHGPPLGGPLVGPRRATAVCSALHAGSSTVSPGRRITPSDRTSKFFTQFRAERRTVMPLYEYHCEKCQRDVTIPMTISQHDQGGAVCPHCGATGLRQQLGTIFTQTSRKS
jgi:putative FmdB family regulatory protein